MGQSESVVKDCYFKLNAETNDKLWGTNSYTAKFVGNTVIGTYTTVGGNIGDHKLAYFGGGLISGNRFSHTGTVNDYKYTIELDTSTVFSNNLTIGIRYPVNCGTQSHITITDNYLFCDPYNYGAFFSENTGGSYSLFVLIENNTIHNTLGYGGGTGILIGNFDYSRIASNKLWNTGFEDGGGRLKRTAIVGNVSNTTLFPSTFKTDNNNLGINVQDNIGTGEGVYIKSVSKQVGATGGSVSIGQVLVRDATDPNKVNYTTTAGDNNVIGVATVTSAPDEYCPVQTEGKCDNVRVDGTTNIAIGDYLTTSTTAGVGQKATTGDTVYAIALEAYTTDDANGVIDAVIIQPRKL